MNASIRFRSLGFSKDESPRSIRGHLVLYVYRREQIGKEDETISFFRFPGNPKVYVEHGGCRIISSDLASAIDLQVREIEKAVAREEKCRLLEEEHPRLTADVIKKIHQAIDAYVPISENTEISKNYFSGMRNNRVDHAYSCAVGFHDIDVLFNVVKSTSGVPVRVYMSITIGLYFSDVNNAEPIREEVFSKTFMTKEDLLSYVF